MFVGHFGTRLLHPSLPSFDIHRAQKPLRMLPELWRRVPNEAEERILNDEELLEARLGRADL